MAGGKRPEGLEYLGVGFEFAAAVGGLALLGYWVDRHFATEPWGVVVGALVGLIGGTYNLIKETMGTGGAPARRGGSKRRETPPRSGRRDDRERGG